MFTDTNVTVETGDTASDSQMQRIWAHLTVKQLLEREWVITAGKQVQSLATSSSVELFERESAVRLTVACFNANVWHRLQLSGSEKEDAKNEALKLSLRYGFVTPLTSMVVTKPQGEDADVLDKPKEGKI